ncbi:hypothetical protein RFI_38020 [Reticulomyxa filosa]|uniref:Uncharacterized protein n=1 Tax=Reticulomyxa filosa TaxID=46433 RepID=X6LD42_RETFI|nr:hypothetical protein RFI_38020 [Reticulomyxa filosa]|eukprot:ETN99453.1 hypothetical protein RFI_38020 [Reticulomyxa filosa]
MFRKMGLDFALLEKSQFVSSVDMYNPTTKKTEHVVYTTPLTKDTTITELFFQMANRLAPIFDEVMTDLFVDVIKSVRVNDTDKKDDKDDNKTQTELAREDIIRQGIQYGPVKTIGRASVKAREYDIVPGITSVKDWVRVALIVENESECVELFNKIMKQFDGKVARVKNGFDPKVKGEDVLHYRSILINLVFDYETYGKLDRQKEKHKHQSDDLEKAANKYWKMICEVQIILREYLNVRGRLHLYYKILRCMETNTNTTAGKVANDFSKYWELPE